VITKGVRIMNRKIEQGFSSGLDRDRATETPIPVDSGLSDDQRRRVKSEVDITGKCCEGGSEGWTG